MGLWQSLLEDSAATRAHVWDGDGYVERPWSSCIELAAARAAALRRAGVAPGDRVALVLVNSYDACASLLGTWLAGCVALSLPTPARAQGVDDYLALIDRICADAGAAALLVDDRAAKLLPDDALAVRTLSPARLPGAGRLWEPPADGDVFFVQYSSGSTSEPKGCMLTPAAVDAQLSQLQATLQLDPERDRASSWLPLSHDWGLFGGLLCPWSNGVPAVLGTPERYVTDPASWFADAARLGATATLGPPFALSLTARALRASALPAPLRLHTVVTGSERVDWPRLERARDELAEHGLPVTALRPGYGLAEATLAVTMHPRGEPLRALEADSRALWSDGAVVPADGAGGTWLVSNGPALDRSSLRIAGEREVGEIVVASPSLACGYLDDADATARRFRDGELLTGDFGFLHDGELYVVGRLDDMIVVDGRNLFLGEVEAELCSEAGVRTGGCVVVEVAHGDAERLTIVAETDPTGADRARLAGRLRARARRAAALRVDDVVFVEPGALPKTPSGKVQRFRCRQLVLDGERTLVEQGSRG
jgi:fatty-acyl-CoA synthase